MKPETSFRQNKVLPFLKKLKNTAFFAIQQLGISGTPDYLLCIHGTFTTLELKSEGGVESKLQKYNRQWVEKCGGVGLVSSPSSWADTKKQLQLMDEGKYYD